MRADRPLLALALLLVAAACSSGSSASTDRVTTSSDPVAEVTAECGGYLPRTELAGWDLGIGTVVRGMVASRTHPDLMWILKETENGTELEAYSISRGVVVAGMRLPGDGVAAEDLGIGPGPEPGRDYLYVGDIGNAEIPLRQTFAVLRFAEPDPANPVAVEPERFQFRYEDRSRDAQAMFVDPETSDIYVVALGRNAPGLYAAQAPFSPDDVATFRLLGTVSPPPDPLVIGADITADGNTIAVRTATTVSLWGRDPGQSIVEAMVTEPCIGELRNPERMGAFAFTGEDREFYSLSLGGGDAKLFVQHSPDDLTAAVGRLAVPPGPGNLAPDVTIVAPSSDLTWTVGDTIALEATARDDQDVDAARFSWDVAVEHCPAGDTCVRRGVVEYVGASAEAVAGEVGFALPLYLDVTLTYTDPAGLVSRDQVQLLPKSSTITFASTPAGAAVRIGEEVTATPSTREVLLDDVIEVSVEPVQVIDGVTYVFTGWSDGGERTHQLDITEEPLELTVSLESRSRWSMEDVSLGEYEGDYIRISADNDYELYVNGDRIGSGQEWQESELYGVDLRAGDVIAVRATDVGGDAGVIAEVRWDGQTTVTSSDWLVARNVQSGWPTPGYDTSAWGAATEYGAYGAAPWLARVDGFAENSPAQWIWSADNFDHQQVFLRTTLTEGAP